MGGGRTFSLSLPLSLFLSSGLLLSRTWLLAELDCAGIFVDEVEWDVVDVGIARTSDGVREGGLILVEGLEALRKLWI